LAGRAEKPTTRQLLRELGDSRRFLFLLVSAAGLATVVSAAEGMWAPALFTRVYHWHEESIGVWLGSITLLAAIPGTYFAGWLIDRMTKGGTADAPIKIAIFSLVPVGVLGVAMPLMPNGVLAFASFLPVLFVKSIAFACGPVAIQLAIPGHLRGQAAGIYYTCVSLLGMVLGPMFIGFLTDHVFKGPEGIRYALVALTAVLVPVIILLFQMARQPFRELRLREEART
jgi:MFS family permease